MGQKQHTRQTDRDCSVAVWSRTLTRILQTLTLSTLKLPDSGKMETRTTKMTTTIKKSTSYLFDSLAVPKPPNPYFLLSYQSQLHWCRLVKAWGGVCTETHKINSVKWLKKNRHVFSVLHTKNLFWYSHLYNTTAFKYFFQALIFMFKAHQCVNSSDRAVLSGRHQMPVYLRNLTRREKSSSIQHYLEKVQLNNKLFH